jgi:hypothetical protein
MHPAIEHLSTSIGLKDNDLMAMVTVYFDDSGTHQQSDIAVASCFISDVRRWKQFDTEWQTVLQEEGIADSGFHMADFVAQKPPFDGWGKTKRDRTVKGLVAVINKCAIIGTTTALTKSDYDRFVTGKLRDKLGHNHYTFAVQSCMAHIEEWRIGMLDTQPYEYVFDLMGKGKHEILDLFDSLIEHKLAVRFGIEPRGYSFQDRRSLLPLQASDILAWESNKYIREYQTTARTPRGSFLSLVDSIPIKARLFGSGSLYEFAKDVTRKYEAINWEGPLGGFFE